MITTTEQQQIKRRMLVLGGIVVLVLCGLFAISVYSYQFVTNTIASKYLDASRKTIMQTTRNLDSMLEKIQAVSMQVVNDPDLKGQSFGAEKYAQMDDKLFKFTESIQDIKQILMFPTETGMRAARTFEAASKSDLDSKTKGTVFVDAYTQQWMRTIVEAKGDAVWFPTIKSGFTRQSFISDHRFFLGRLVTSPSETNLPIMIIESNVSALDQLFSNVQLGERGSFYIINEDHTVVYSSDAQEIGNPIVLPFEIPGPMGVSTFESAQGETQFAIYQTARYAPWKVVGVVSKSELASGAGSILFFSLISLLLLSMVLWLVVTLMRRFYKVHELLQISSIELEASSRQLAIQRDELQYLNKIKDQILANTSHELKTPINGIIGIAESLTDGVTGPLSDTTNRNLQLIINSGRRLSTLVNDILDFSKMRKSKLEMRLRKVDIAIPLDMTLAILKSLIGKKSVEIINHFVPNDSGERDYPLVIADENRLQQIFHNLISNAIKFTERGSVTISYQKEPGWLSIDVVDTGIGIAREQLHHVFEAFEQLDGSIERKYGGTGLGLAVTKQLVELHEGTIQVESVLGKGSRFTFRLRTAEASEYDTTWLMMDHVPEVDYQIVHEESVISPTHDELITIPSTGARGEILVVDDEPINAQVIVNLLARYDYRVIAVENGLEAIRMIDEGYLPDLILLDVMMPHLSGYETLQRIRTVHPLELLPVLLVTVHHSADDISAGFQSGANDYVVKPFEKSELLARIQTHIQLVRANRRTK